jgi:HK97 family phage major capsid protein
VTNTHKENTVSTKHTDLLGKAAAAAKAAREIAEKADNENREMTAEERESFNAKFAEATDLKSQADVAKKDAEVMAQAAEIAALVGDPESAKADLDAQLRNPTREQLAKTLGRSIVDSAEFKAMMAPFGDRIPEKTRIQSDPIAVKSFIRTKSLFTGASDTSGGAFVVADQSGIVEMLGRRDLRLRDLVSVRTTGSDTVEYVEQTSHTNNAAETAEATTSAAPTQDGSTGALIKAAGGGYKPEGAWAFVRRTATVKTIAEWVPATKRSLADAGQLEGLINDELRKDIEEREDGQILNGDGTGENLTGILNWSGIQTQAFSTSLFESVRKGLTLARTVGRVNPSAIVMNPSDVETVDLAQDANDRFYGMGPFGIGPRTLWGVPVVEDESQPAGFALLGDFSKAVIWDREQTTVTMTDSHEDFFVRNLVAILAEERVAFAVTRPKAFVKVDIAA